MDFFTTTVCPSLIAHAVVRLLFQSVAIIARRLSPGHSSVQRRGRGGRGRREKRKKKNKTKNTHNEIIQKQKTTTTTRTQEQNAVHDDGISSVVGTVGFQSTSRESLVVGRQ